MAGLTPLRFRDVLPTLPAIDHLVGLDLLDAAGAVVHHIPAVPGKLGSLRVYHALALAFDGQLSAAAIAQGLTWFAEQVAEARAQPGSHPNIDLLLAQQAQPRGWRLRPRSS